MFVIVNLWGPSENHETSFSDLLLLLVTEQDVIFDPPLEHHVILKFKIINKVAHIHTQFDLLSLDLI